MSEYICELHEDWSSDQGLLELGEVREEIIRCRDCIQFNERTGICAYHSPNGYSFTPETYGFCAWAKRRKV